MCLIHNCNDKSSIGSCIEETGWLLKFRINEHRKAVLKEYISNFAMTARFYSPILLEIELLILIF